MVDVLPHLLFGLLTGAAIGLWPGNTLAVTIREASRRGALAGVGSAAGRTGADLLVLMGIGVTVLRVPGLFAGDAPISVLFGVLAGTALAVAGWRLMDYHSGGALHRERGDLMLRAWHRHLFVDRFLGSLSSPLWHIFWWTAGLRLVAEAGRAGDAWGVACFGAGYLVSGLAWQAFVAVRLRSPRRERALRDRPYRILTSLGGLILVALGGKVAVQAIAGSPLRDALTKIVAAVFA